MVRKHKETAHISSDVNYVDSVEFKSTFTANDDDAALNEEDVLAGVSRTTNFNNSAVSGGTDTVNIATGAATGTKTINIGGAGSTCNITADTISFTPSIGSASTLSQQLTHYCNAKSLYDDSGTAVYRAEFYYYCVVAAPGKLFAFNYVRPMQSDTGPIDVDVYFYVSTTDLVNNGITWTTRYARHQATFTQGAMTLGTLTGGDELTAGRLYKQNFTTAITHIENYEGATITIGRNAGTYPNDVYLLGIAVNDTRA